MRRNRNVLHEAEPYIKKNNRRSVWQKCVRVMGSIVVFCTTYALILPAITMVKDTQCQLEEHIHDENCYIKAAVEEAKQPTCTYDSLGVHVHTQGCYDDAGALLCGSADYLVHVHGASCTDEEGALLCRLPEVKEHEHTLEECYQEVMKEGHIHTDSCYIVELGGLVCEISENEGHTHSDGCYVRSESLNCGQEEAAGHTHGAECYQTTVTCTLPADAHVHGESCYELQTQTAENGDLISDLILVCTQSTDAHVHGEGCSATALVCTTPEAAGHAHSDGCYDRVLSCTAAEGQGHTHGESCYAQNKTLACGLEENQTGEVDLVLNCDKKVVKLHSHGDACYETWLDENNQEQKRLSCTELIVEEHVHGDSCFTTFEVFEEEPEELTCGLTDKAGHAHSDACMDESGSIICGQAEEEGHQHTFLCYGEWELICEKEAHTHSIECNPVLYGCGLDEHKHDENCYAADGTLTCGLEEHSHNEECALPELTEEEQAKVDLVIAHIDSIPSADEIDAKIAEFEAAGDYEGEEAWLTDVYIRVKEVYTDYLILGDVLKLYVTNADKLLELEYIWSAQTLIEEINSAAPTVVRGVSTTDFIDLNLYNYNYNINQKWSSNKKYPGFQWPGGAYNYASAYNSSADDGIPNYQTDRHAVDSVSFGDNIVSNFDYSHTYYGKSTSATSVGILYNNSNASSTGAINRLWWNGTGSSITNRPVGISTDIPAVSNNLVNGYPALLDGTSLSYLFTNNSENGVTKMNSQSIDGLFQINPISGLYFYNSRENHAQYSNNEFTLYNQIITPQFFLYPFGNFLPFNTITDRSQATQVGAFNYSGGMKNYVEGIIADLGEALADGETYQDAARRQLRTMLQEYREDWTRDPSADGTTWSNLTSGKAIEDFFNGSGGPTSNDSFITQEFLNNMYNIDWDVATDFFFGMDMTITIQQPKNGLTGKDNGNNTTGQWGYAADGKTFLLSGEPDTIPDYPMVFNFSGDDDVWVYIDGVLFLDLTGIHRHVGGTIDFHTGRVHYFDLDLATGDTHQNQTSGASPYRTYTFAQILEAAGKNPDDYLATNGEGYHTFKDYSTHEFKFYYMERGSGSSVCRMNFNFPILRKNTVSVEKKLTDDSADIEALGNPDFTFQILDVDANGNKTENSFFVAHDEVGNQWAYNLYDTDGSILQLVEITAHELDGSVEALRVYNGEGKLLREETTVNGHPVIKDYPENGQVLTVDEYGRIKLKAGQRAEFVGIGENWGEYYVRELFETTDQSQYQVIEVNGVATQTEGTTIAGIPFVGVESPILDASNGSTSFEFDNRITTENLTELSVKKNVEAHFVPNPSTTYRMYIELDGEPLPNGLPVTITAANGTTTPGTISRQNLVTEIGGQAITETYSYIDLKAGEMVTIPNIISGSKFTVWEAQASSAGFNVSYSAENSADPTQTVESTSTSVNQAGHQVPAISGVVRVATAVTVEVTNSQRGTQIEIPVTKNFKKFEGADHTYSFTLLETDEKGTPLTNGYSITEALTFTSNGDVKTLSPVSYLKREFATLPGTKYYVIYESGEAASDSLDNTEAYLVEVTIEEVSDSPEVDKPITARITKITKGTWNGTAIVNLGTASETAIVFTNTLKTKLTVTKTVEHGKIDTDPQFGFRLELGIGDSGLGSVDQLEIIVSKKDDGTAYEETVVYDAESGYGFQLGDGDSIEFSNLPVGLAWTVTETDAPGYLPSWGKSVNGVVTRGEGSATNGVLSLLNHDEVDFFNKSGYELPETGGAGTLLYTMAGLMLIFSAAYLLYRYQNRRRGAYESP